MAVATMTPGARISSQAAEVTVERLLHAHAAIFALRKLTSFQDGVYRAVVEFCDVLAAQSALVKLSTAIAEVCAC
jgi:hypothetical protein